MGCSPSGSRRERNGEVVVGGGGSGAGSAGEVLDRFLRLERDLWREEQESPAPALHHAAARLDAATAALAAARARLPPAPAPAPDEYEHDPHAYQHQVPQTSTSLEDVLLDLKIDRNPARAAEHEEFIANINRQELAKNEITLLERRVEEAQEEVKMATAKVNYLQNLYQQQDTLLGEVFGEQYGSTEERRLELHLDRLRSFRDTLAGGALEWKEAYGMAQRAADDMRAAVAAWERLPVTNDAASRTRLLAEVRGRAQEAAAAAAAAHAALPGAGLPSCTPRELAAVAHALLYIFTDAQDPDKAAHAGRLYRHFWVRACELADWIRKTMASTLERDLEEVDQQVAEATAELRALRVQLIKEKFGDTGPPFLPTNAVMDGGRPNPKAMGMGVPFQAGFDPRYPNGMVGAAPRAMALGAEGRRRLEHSALFSREGPNGGAPLYGPRQPRDAVAELRAELEAKMAASGAGRWSAARAMERRVLRPQ